MPEKAHRVPAARSRATRAGKVAVVERPAEVNATRQRVIEAAILCILEQGFYRASSNAIAERAGYSERMMFRLLRDLYQRWGVANRTEAIIHARDNGWL